MIPNRMKVLALFSLLTVTSLGVMAQNNFSPYSQMGIGDVEDGFYNRTTGLGNTGIAYRNNRFLINNNPASFSGLANQYFTMETGIRGTFVDYAGSPVAPSSTQSADITFRRLAMGIKLTKNWGTSIGLVPFSTQNFEFNVPYYIQGSNSEVANHYYQGHGSVNKAYWANAYEFFHHLSIGVEAGYIFGQLNQKDILQNTLTGATETSTENDINLQNLYMTYGMQFYGKVGKHWGYSIGGTYSQRADLLASNIQVVRASDSSIVNYETLPDTYLTLPNAFGAGISITHNDKYTWLADYRYQDWNSVARKNSYPGQGYNIVSSERGSLGFEISQKKNFYNNKVELNYFQTGLYYGNSYLQINGKQITDMGVTMGVGINSLKSPLAYSVVFQYGIKGTTDNNLIRENYVNLTFVINYGSIWYTKGKKFD
ncbi:hypothetical protein GCM10011511_11060 [Puia dinghuensis]|uniref:Uncharacterized protein n=2 Tax=Puia dinghuensis TaxID=1792502 RepID=A0A8J2UAH7_9BACT|nr:hypothetical protein GCM10011511_11060 [Puia dinghuensis]